MAINFPSTTNQATDGSFTHTDSTAGITWTWDGTSWSAGGVGGSGGASDTATYASTAGIATYASTAGIATYASTAGIATYASTAGVSTAAQGLSGTPNLNVGIVTATSFSGFSVSGLLKESVNVTAGTLSANPNIDVENGMVHLFTTAETTTSTPNIRYSASTSLDSAMNTGEAVSVTLITTAAAAGYATTITIDGANSGLNWIGGSAPVDGGTSGVDLYAFTIIKTGSAAFTVVGSQTKTS